MHQMVTSQTDCNNVLLRCLLPVLEARRRGFSTQRRVASASMADVDPFLSHAAWIKMSERNSLSCQGHRSE